MQEKHVYLLQKLDDLSGTFSSWTNDLLEQASKAIAAGEFNEARKLNGEAKGTNRALKEIVRVLQELQDDVRIGA